MHAELVQENSGNTKKSCTKFLCTKAKNRKNIRERRKQRYQSIVKAVIFSYSIRKTLQKSFTARTYLDKPPDFFYVFLSGNVGFRREKHTFHGRKTYGSPTGNLENIKKKESYLPSISEK